MTRLPISGTQFDRLGKRLVEGTATAADFEIFEEVRIVYGYHVIPEGRYAQNIVVATLERALSPGSSEIFTKTPKTLDRRQTPSFGYRAVHVVVFVHGLPVEIQVRTELQHMWAEATERLADRWGRGSPVRERPRRSAQGRCGRLDTSSIRRLP